LDSLNFKLIPTGHFAIRDRKSPSQQALRCGKKLSIFAFEESKNCLGKVPFELWKKLWKAEELFLASKLQVAAGSIRTLLIAL
jgi:hypothetical protein